MAWYFFLVVIRKGALLRTGGLTERRRWSSAWIQRARVIGLGLAMSLWLASTPVSAEGPVRPPQLILTTVHIERESWRLVAAEGIGRSPRRVCFGVGFRPKPGSPYLFSSTSTCPTPAFSGPIDARHEVEKEVLGMVFPRNVVQVHLDLDEAGKRDLNLRLVSYEQARKIHVDRFRWGYVKVLGPSCLHEAVGYNASGNIVYRGEDEPGALCVL